MRFLVLFLSQVAIWFQNAQAGDFLLIDSLIMTEGATLSDEEMVALCSPSTYPVPISTSTSATWSTEKSPIIAVLIGIASCALILLSLVVLGKKIGISKENGGR